MLNATPFENMREACEYIKKLLAELPHHDFEFEIIHSITATECDEGGGHWETLTDLLLDFLRDLDAHQGQMIQTKDDDCVYWNFIANEPEDESYAEYYEPTINKCYVEAGEGVVVLYDDMAFDNNAFPVIVVKHKFWQQYRKQCEEILSVHIEKEDFTQKISPALYVEIISS